MTTRTKPRLRLEMTSCDHCSKSYQGFYPKRAAVRSKMSPWRFCSPQCQQAHWRARQRQARLRTMPARYCPVCGDDLPREVRPGRPRRYCSQACGYAAANKRRPPSPAIAALEAAVRRADQSAQQAWADVKAVSEKATAARRKLEDGKAARLREVKAAGQSRYYSPWETPKSLDVVAQEAVAKALALVDRAYEAYRQFNAAGPDDRQYRRDVFNKAVDAVEADDLAKLELEAREAEIARVPAQAAARATAESASEAAELARGELAKARRRLDRRAKAARIRRAIGAGREPEELEEQGPEDADDGQVVYPSWHAKAGEPIN